MGDRGKKRTAGERETACKEEEIVFSLIGIPFIAIDAVLVEVNFLVVLFHHVHGNVMLDDRWVIAKVGGKERHGHNHATAIAGKVEDDVFDIRILLYQLEGI